MEPRIEYIRELVRVRDWSGSEFARKSGLSRAEANRFLNGKRKGGKKLIGGLLQAFPEEKLETLFFLTNVSPNVNIESRNETNKSSLRRLSSKTVPVKHPQAHQLACTMNESEGRIEIVEGDNITVLLVPPGSFEVRHTTKVPEVIN